MRSEAEWLELARRHCFRHNNPRIVRSVAEALQKLMHASSTYYNDQEILLAERLALTLPAPLSKCMFALSGSDANEAAIGIARAASGRYEVASPHVSFHGLSDTPRPEISHRSSK